MTADVYDEAYYKNTYGSEYALKQQKWLDDYLNGNESGFTRRIDYIFNYFDNLPTEGSLLDLGCGVGTFALIFAQRGLETVGLDISEASINAANANVAKLKLENCSFVRGSSAVDHFGENRFDHIFAADIIEHLPKNVLHSTLTNCLHWLKPGGKLYIHTTPTKYYYLSTNRPAALMWPATFFPQKAVNYYVKFLDRVVVQFLYKVRFGKSYDEIVAGTGHCNPPHPIQFEQDLRRIGFDIEKYQLLEEVLSGLPYDLPKYAFGHKLIHNNLVLRPSIICLAIKKA